MAVNDDVTRLITSSEMFVIFQEPLKVDCVEVNSKVVVYYRLLTQARATLLTMCITPYFPWNVLSLSDKKVYMKFNCCPIANVSTVIVCLSFF